MTPLSYQIRSELFAHLATMEASGLPFERALGLLKLRGNAQKRLQAMREKELVGMYFVDAAEKKRSVH